VGPGTKPDEFETKLIREIASMPPGRSGYTTIKTIEETLRSKAGQLGGTRKEVPMRLERLQAMGLFKRETRPRGTGQVEVGELVMDHPLMAGLTAGIVPAQAPPPRLPRQPRSAAPRPATIETPSSAPAAMPEAEVIATASPAEVTTPEVLPEAEPVVEEIREAFNEPVPQAEPEPEPVEDKPEAVKATPFRWVTGVGGTETATPAEATKAEAEAETKPKRTPRKSPAKPRTGSRAKKAAPATEAVSEVTASDDAEEADSTESASRPAEIPTDQSVPV
jgi:hypothetical protein